MHMYDVVLLAASKILAINHVVGIWEQLFPAPAFFKNQNIMVV